MVIQGVLNRKIGETWGLGSAVLLNALIFFILALALFLAGKWVPESLPPFLRYTDSRDFKWWYALPGICGFLLVLGLPWSMRSLGASKSIVLLITAQVLTSVLADRFILDAEMSSVKMAGALIAMVGAGLVILG